MEADNRIHGNFGFTLGERCALDYSRSRPLRLRDISRFGATGAARHGSGAGGFATGLSGSGVIPGTCKVGVGPANTFFDSAAVTVDVSTSEVAMVWGFRKRHYWGLGPRAESRVGDACRWHMDVISQNLKGKYRIMPSVERHEPFGGLIGVGGLSRSIIGMCVPVKNPLGYTALSAVIYCDKNLSERARENFARYVAELERQRETWSVSGFYRYMVEMARKSLSSLIPDGT